MTQHSKRYRTQWAAQFYAAAELTRRGYLVSITLGNAPVVDLLVVSPSGKHFMVDVKGLSSKTCWLIRRPEAQDDLYFVLVYIPPASGSPLAYQSPDFYVLSSAEVVKELEETKSVREAAGTYRPDFEDIRYKPILKYQNRWEVLPC